MIGANAKDTITVDEVVGGQLKQTFANNVTVCISDLMTKNNISFNQIQSYLNEVVSKMNTLLDDSWRSQYGLEIQDLSLNIVPSEESRQIMREADSEISREKRRGDLYSSNPSGLMAAATADTMRNASSNDNGAMMGFMGMNMAQNAGANVMGAASEMTPTPTPASPTPAPVGGVVMNESVPVKESTTTVAPDAASAAQTTDAKFCNQCGAPAKGNFCSSCGAKLN